MKAPGIASLNEGVFPYSKGQAQASGLTLCNEKNICYRDTVLGEFKRLCNRNLTSHHPKTRLHVLIKSFREVG